MPHSSPSWHPASASQSPLLSTHVTPLPAYGPTTRLHEYPRSESTTLSLSRGGAGWETMLSCKNVNWGSHVTLPHDPWGPPTQSAPRPAQMLLSCGLLAAHPMFQNEQGTQLKYWKPNHKCGSQLPRCAHLSWDIFVKTNRKELHCPERGQVRV